jgi:ribonucleoside-diphosphate reductase alpha chain
MGNNLTDYSRYIHASRYARWVESENRRETWEETVGRYTQFWTNRFGDKFPAEVIGNAIASMKVMPSMRTLMTAGRALERDELAGYNCSYVAVDHPRAFDEILYILMVGTGVGFSVERQFINRLPTVPEELHESETTITVKDSRIGWAAAYRELISLLYGGRIPKYDTSKVRPAGSRLKTFGGRSSGPQPLIDLFEFTISKFKTAQGRRLSSLEVHDLVCKIADIVVVGGVRRSALISLSNLTDERLRTAKSGQWWLENGQRALANNSVAYTELPDIGIFMKEWEALYESKSGERGVFNRVSATNKAASSGRRDTTGFEYGTNPCGEIILRSAGLCNLSEVIIRADDTIDSLKDKVRVATIIGTFQSTLTNFRYVRPVWRANAEEERLLGVSLTGIMDHPILSKTVELDRWLGELKQVAIETNKHWAEVLGIEPSVAITTVKPSGTVSQLVDSASGIHPRYSEYYIRTVRADAKDPLATFLEQQGVPCEPDFGKPDSVKVFSFPQKAPATAVLRENMTAIDQLEHYLAFNKHWAEHNCSITVYVRESEWMDVGAWVYRHFNEIGGVSFLPYSDHSYKQAPYQPCSKEVYEEAVAKFPKIDWSAFAEAEDTLTSYKELACVSGVCEI